MRAKEPFALDELNKKIKKYDEILYHPMHRRVTETLTLIREGEFFFPTVMRQLI